MRWYEEVVVVDVVLQQELGVRFCQLGMLTNVSPTG